jgi:hypothetical protein
MASTGLILLPAEILALAISYLPNRDIKSLRLPYKVFHATAKLRLDRVFLSATPRDVEVFWAVANDDTFRYSIVEIIWEDTVIQDTAREDNGSEYNVSEADEDIRIASLRPPLVLEGVQREHFELRSYYQDDVLDRPEHAISTQLPVHASWERFQERRGEQRPRQAPTWLSFVIDSPVFPPTPSIHGVNLGHPLYDTPTIRSFPPGFNYPLPYRWPTAGEGEPRVEILPWADEDRGTEAGRDRWRGFRIIDNSGHLTESPMRAWKIGLKLIGLNRAYYWSASGRRVAPRNSGVLSVFSSCCRSFSVSSAPTPTWQAAASSISVLSGGIVRVGGLVAPLVRARGLLRGGVDGGVDDAVRCRDVKAYLAGSDKQTRMEACWAG